jgi:23S rRNA pseudouridine1911/1915/1917 synthase
VHRLDAGTSGLMVVAKSEHAYSDLKRQFHDREPIGRHPSSSWKFAVTAAGKPSVTHYETIEAFRGASLLEIHLETGRTHQIRVHMAAQRHPCVGDAMYGADPTMSARLGLSRQWLHAMRLGFRHPATGRHVEFTSVYPDDLAHALGVLRGE